MQRRKQSKFLPFFLFVLVLPLLLVGNPDVYADAPNAPTSLTATAASSSQINLSWTASTLNQITATGGTVSSSGGIETHTFSPGTSTLTVSSVGGTGTGVVNVKINAGGGGGGDGGDGSCAGCNQVGGSGGGGGGGGGTASNSAMSVTAQAYTVVVGAGGTVAGGVGNSGGSSSFNGLSTSGGGGGNVGGSGGSPGGSGGSPGGGGTGGSDGTAGGGGVTATQINVGTAGGSGGGAGSNGNGGAGGGGGGGHGGGSTPNGGKTGGGTGNDGKITISFENPIPAVSGYKIERSLNNSTWSTIVSNTGTSTTTYSDTGLTPNTKYYYRVSGINADSTSSPSNIPSATTGVESPSGLTVTESVSKTAHLSWTAPATGTVLGYKIEDTTNGGSTWNTVVANTTTTATTYDHSGLTAGLTYGYRVSTYESQGTSLPSSTASKLIWQTITISAFENDNSTTFSCNIIQSNSSSSNNIFSCISGVATINGLTGNQNFTVKDTTSNLYVKKQYNFNSTASSTLRIISNVFLVDCPASGTGNDLLLEINESAVHRTSSSTIPTCSSSSLVTLNQTDTANGNSASTGTSSLYLNILNTGYKNNPTSFKVNGTSVGTTISGNNVTSSSYNIGIGTKTFLMTYALQLFYNVTSSVTPSVGGGGGSTTVNTVLSLLGLKADTTPVTADFGQIVNGKTSFTWGTSTNATITFWSAGVYSKWITYPNTPFTLSGIHTTTNNTVFSTQTVNYQLVVPSIPCDKTTGVTPLCAVNGQTYTIPVTFNVMINGQTYTATTNVSVTVSNFTTTPAAIQTYVIFGSMFAIVLGGGGYIRNKYYNEKRNKKSKYSKMEDDLGKSKTAKKLRKILGKK